MAEIYDKYFQIRRSRWIQKDDNPLVNSSNYQVYPREL